MLTLTFIVVPRVLTARSQHAMTVANVAARMGRADWIDPQHSSRPCGRTRKDCQPRIASSKHQALLTGLTMPAQAAQPSSCVHIATMEHRHRAGSLPQTSWWHVRDAWQRGNLAPGSARRLPTCRSASPPGRPPPCPCSSRPCSSRCTPSLWPDQTERICWTAQTPERAQGIIY